MNDDNYEKSPLAIRFVGEGLDTTGVGIEELGLSWDRLEAFSKDDLTVFRCWYSRAGISHSQPISWQSGRNSHRLCVDSSVFVVKLTFSNGVFCP